LENAFELSNVLYIQSSKQASVSSSFALDDSLATYEPDKLILPLFVDLRDSCKFPPY